jgi:hypothetical protein
MLFPIVLKAAGTLDALHGHYGSKYGAKARRARLAAPQWRKNGRSRPWSAWINEAARGVMKFWAVSDHTSSIQLRHCRLDFGS